MRILFAASRNAGWEHRLAISDALLSVVVCSRDRGPHTLVVGKGRGGDEIAEGLARGWDWTIEGHPAAWDRYGPAAGPMRNTEMVQAGGDRLVAMPDGRGLDSGTGDLIRKAINAGMPVNVRPIRIEEATLL